MTMPLAVPATAGVPTSWPVEPLKVAHDGRLTMLNVNVSASRSLALGANEYWVPCSIEVAGVPLIVGALFGGALTVIENAGNCADA